MKIEFLHTRLPLRARFIIAFFFYALAALLQVIMPMRVNLPIFALRATVLALLVIPLWFLKVKNFTNKPPGFKTPKAKAPAKNTGSGSGESWMPVTMADLDRFRDRLRATRKVKIPAFYYKGFGTGITVFFLFILFFLTVFILVFIGFNILRFFMIFEIYLLFFPFLWFGQIEKWEPPTINEKILALDPVLEAKLPEKLKLEVMLFFEGEKESQIPSDIRLMLAPGPSASEEVKNELLGAQFQVASNSGPEGSVPYLYAVFITKGQGKIWKSLNGIKAGRFITEGASSAEGDAVYGTVVLRLDTKSRSDGYHTKEGDVIELLALVIEALEILIV